MTINDTDQRREAAIARAKAEDAARASEAYQVEATQDPQHELSPQQVAVLETVHEALQLTTPFSVLPPVKPESEISARAKVASGQLLIDVTSEGFLDRVAVTFSVGCYDGWLDLNHQSGSDLYDRIWLTASTARKGL